MFVTIPPRINVTVPNERIEKINRSMEEVKNLQFRAVHCPYCGIYLFDVFEDIQGHIAVKCNKCKSMAFYYFAWKNGIKAENRDLQEWDELSQKQYLQICANNKKVGLEDRRFFEKVSGIEQGDDTYYFECDIDAYRRYRRRKEKEAYKEKEEIKDAELFGEITLLSLDAPYEDSDGYSYSLHDIVADENSAFEERLTRSLDLCEAIDNLSNEERCIIRITHLRRMWKPISSQNGKQSWEKVNLLALPKPN